MLEAIYVSTPQIEHCKKAGTYLSLSVQHVSLAELLVFNVLASSSIFSFQW